MKKILLFLLFLFCIQVPAVAVDYSLESNWVINQNLVKDKSNFDVFYVYPTIFASNKDILFDWSKTENNLKAKNFVTGQTNIFNQQNVRIFAPFVRQVELSTALSEIDKFNENVGYKGMNSRFAIEDTTDALNYYLKNYNNGRPFILFGHSQGAVDLLFSIINTNLMKNDKFVAAYLIGCPKVSEALLKQYNLKPSKSKDDLQVVIVWNTQKEGVNNKYFATKNGYVINPLNWSVEKSASRLRNIKSEFYDFTTKTWTTKRFLCGAKIDKNNGTLLVNLPEHSVIDAYGQIGGDGVFHVSDVWLFSRAISKNAELRVKTYNKRHKTGF